MAKHRTYYDRVVEIFPNLSEYREAPKSETLRFELEEEDITLTDLLRLSATLNSTAIRLRASAYCDDYDSSAATEVRVTAVKFD